MKKVAFMFSILALGAVAALAGTISVPQFNDGGGNTNSSFFPPTLSATWVALKNNTASTQTYTILYYALDGANRTPGANTFSIGPNASISWRPVNTTDPNQGPGIVIPTATGVAGSGSATILYTDTVDPSGRVLINVAGSGSSYAFAMFPAQ